MKLFVLATLALSASAFEIPALSRRAIMARVAAAAPLAAAAVPAAFADGASGKFDTKNKMLGTAKATKIGIEPEGVSKSIGREASVDEVWGAALPAENKALGFKGATSGSTSDYAFNPTTPSAQKPGSSMDRLLSRK